MSAPIFKPLPQIAPQITPKVIASTQRWLVVFKPAGWLTIPGRFPPGESPPILQEWAAREISSQVWTVHRLDLETSGVVLFARTAQDHKEANQWFQQKKMKKVYHCLAAGKPSAPILKIKAPIEGVPASTQVEVRESFGPGFLAKVLPQTGKRHQIRIHLASQGYPIFGDTRYGGVREVVFENSTSTEKSLTINRVALHASSLQLPTGEIFEAPFPDDFALWLDRLRSVGKSKNQGGGSD